MRKENLRGMGRSAVLNVTGKINKMTEKGPQRSTTTRSLVTLERRVTPDWRERMSTSIN